MAAGYFNFSGKKAPAASSFGVHDASFINVVPVIIA